MKRLFLLLIMAILSAAAPAQQAVPSRPKLVVGLVVDQMRWDYLYRYAERYTTGGFKRLLSEGFSCENAFLDFTPTYTAPGHAGVYTGSVPSLHGIIGNSWYSRELKKFMYCTDDDSVQGVGTMANSARMSPKNLWSTTITDELKLAQNFRNKTIAISLKDRGSVIPGGHTANAAYWFDNTTGGWVTSTYYMRQLPDWIRTLNARRLPDSFLKKNWEPLFPISTYQHNSGDVKSYEDIVPGEDNDFTHRTETILANRYETFRYIPAGNTFTFETGKAAIENEALGNSSLTDFLSLSFSTTDYAGHRFGPNSVEMEDIYLRFDRDLNGFLQYLDKKIGKGQYLVFLTADHGAAHIPGYALENKIPAGFSDDQLLKQALNDAVQREMRIADAVTTVINYQVYINQDNVSADKKQAVKNIIVQTLLAMPAVSHAFDPATHAPLLLPDMVSKMVRNGYNQKLGGDVQFIFRPQWFDGFSKGTTHGSWNPYDSHLPLLWLGWKIRPGRTYRQINISDIAPTLAAMLQIQMPSASIGQVITEIVK